MLAPVQIGAARCLIERVLRETWKRRLAAEVEMINNATGAGSTVLWEFALMHMITAEVPPMRRATLTCGGSRRDQFRPEVGDHLVARMLATPANTADATFGTPLTQAAEKAIEHDQGAFFVCMRDYPEVEQRLGSIVLGEKREARGR